MYIPDAFRIETPSEILKVIRSYSFATLVTADLAATHLPLIVQSEDPLILAGHMAKANPHWRSLEGADCLVIFQGPHTYISPTWYETSPNVPTWNYVTVHVYCQAKLLLEPKVVLSHLKDSVRFFEPDLPAAQPESMEEAYLLKMLGGVVAFELRVERLEAKAKLNQNKKEVDRLSVRQKLLSCEDPELMQVGALMPEDLANRT